MINADQQ